uniref:G protein-coupled receptor n=1 Tax=Steinernema glaseri TaxID=37863 RepID=A0A1I8AB12_9BILA
MDIFFDQSKYDHLYGCSHLSEVDMQKAVTRDPNLTIPSMILGTIYLITYVPTLIVLCKKQYFQKPHYKLLLLLGVCDLFMTVNSIVYGIIYAEGVVFCKDPSFHFILGIITQACWAGQSLTCVILLLSAVLEVRSKSLSSTLFGGYRTFVFCGIVIVYMSCFAVFTKPLIFSPATVMPSYNPYANLPKHVVAVDPSEYFNLPALLNNVAFIAALVASFTALVLVVGRSKIEVRSKVQVKVIRQCAFACSLNVIPSAFLICCQFVSLPIQLGYLFVLLWQMAVGARAIMLLYSNKSIREGYFDVVFKAKAVSSVGAMYSQPIKDNWI